MATLVELTRSGALSRLNPVLDADQQEFRAFYAGARLERWILEILPTLEGTSAWSEISPIEQVDDFLALYASGETLTYGWTFKPLVHLGDGVWEMKTADVRIFGWFAEFDCFVGVVADSTERTKRHNLYHGYAGVVVRFRDSLDLDQPKFIAGDDPHAVVSDFSFP
jgi:hypothetical protein